MNVQSLNVNPIVLTISNLLGVEHLTAHLFISAFLSNITTMVTDTPLELEQALDFSIREALDLIMEDSDETYVELVLLNIKPRLMQLTMNMLSNKNITNYNISTSNQMMFEMREN